MRLSLIVLRCPDAVVPETREIEGGEFSLGRGPGVDWVLPDPDRVLSKRHCVLGFRAGDWHLADTSTNGTFLNREEDPVGGGAPRRLRDGDRVRLGAYEIELRLAEAPLAAGRGGGRPELMDDPFARVSPATSGSLSRPAAGPGPDPFAEPSDARPFGQPAFGEPPFGAGPAAWDAPMNPIGGFDVGATPAPGGFQPGNLPADFDPFAPEKPDFGGVPLGAPTQPDHSPAFEDAVQLPRAAASQLPDDWDIEQSARQAAPRRPQPQAVVPAAVPRAAPPETPGIVAPAPGIVTAPAAPGIVAAPAAPGIVAAPPPAVAVPDLLVAFLAGAGLPDARPPNPEATMAALGSAFRALIAGMRDILMARADIKSEFRIEQTQVRARGNNPLKFSISDDDALTALLGTGRPVEITPAAAIRDALHDIKLHELAFLAAMQAAVRALLGSFDPARLRAEADQAGGLNLLPAQKRARAFDAFEALHAKTQLALSDDFDSVFGRAFARAYEQALAEASQKEPR